MEVLSKQTQGLLEISRKELLVSDAHMIYRDSYALAAGFALGFINLGTGNAVATTVTETLKRYITGSSSGPTNKPVPNKSEAFENQYGHLHAREIQYDRFKEGYGINTGNRITGFQYLKI